MKLRKYGQINGDKMKKRITLTLILSTTKLTKDLFLQNLSESLKVIFLINTLTVMYLLSINRKQAYKIYYKLFQFTVILPLYFQLGILTFLSFDNEIQSINM